MQDESLINVDLAAFLSEAAARPMEWGRCDCSLLVAEWIERVRGIHPAQDLIGRYADEASGRAIVESEGGLVAVFRKRLAALGLETTRAPEVGDVAVVTCLRGERYGAIRAEHGWAVKTKRGLIIAGGFRPLQCWSLSHA